MFLSLIISLKCLKGSVVVELLVGNRFFTCADIQSGSLKSPGFIAVNQQIMDNQTICQQITRLGNTILLRNHAK